MLVPMKPLRESKSRLQAALDTPARSALALFMLRRVLQAAGSARSDRVRYVVGGDARIQRIAEAEGARWLPDQARDLNAALADGARAAFGHGAEAALILPGDLALLTPDDVDALIEASAGLSRVVLAAAVRDGGTNAILLPRPAFFNPLFGIDSFARHVAALRSAGTTFVALQRPGLDFDLDTPEDLASWRRCCPKEAASLDIVGRHRAGRHSGKSPAASRTSP